MRGHRLSYSLGAILIIAALFTQYKAWKNKGAADQVIKNDGLPELRIKKPVSLVEEMGPWTLFIGGALLVGLGYYEQRKKEKINKS